MPPVALLVASEAIAEGDSSTRSEATAIALSKDPIGAGAALATVRGHLLRRIVRIDLVQSCTLLPRINRCIMDNQHTHSHFGIFRSRREYQGSSDTIELLRPMRAASQPVSCKILPFELA